MPSDVDPGVVESLELNGANDELSGRASGSVSTSAATDSSAMPSGNNGGNFAIKYNHGPLNTASDKGRSEATFDVVRAHGDQNPVATMPRETNSPATKDGGAILVIRPSEDSKPGATGSPKGKYGKSPDYAVNLVNELAINCSAQPAISSYFHVS